MMYCIILRESTETTTIILCRTQFEHLKTILPSINALADNGIIELTCPYITSNRHIRSVIDYLLGTHSYRTRVINETAWRAAIEFNISANFLAVPHRLMWPMNDYKVLLPIGPSASELQRMIDPLDRLLSSGMDQKDRLIVVQYICNYLDKLDLNKLPYVICSAILEHELQREVLVITYTSRQLITVIDLMMNTERSWESNVLTRSPDGRFYVAADGSMIQSDDNQLPIIFIRRVRRPCVWSRDSNVLCWLEASCAFMLNIQERTTTKIAYLKHLKRYVKLLAVSDDGALLVIHTKSGAFLYHVQTRRWAQFNTRNNSLICRSDEYIFSPNNRKIISDWSDMIYVWDVDCTGDIVITLKIHGSPIKCDNACFSPDSKHLGWIDHARYLHIYDVDTWRLLRKLNIAYHIHSHTRDRLSQPTYAADGKYIYFACNNMPSFVVLRLDLETERVNYVHSVENKFSLHYVKAPNIELIRKLTDVINKL